ncbi:MAG: hypothetical protein ABIG31_05755 [Candidatus Omnitrophota bacterium]
MEKKRSKGVTFWAWFFIVSNLIELLPVINLKQQLTTYNNIVPIYHIVMLFFTVVISLASIICGIYLLRLNDYARKSVIVLGITSIILMPFFLMSGLKQINSGDLFEKQKQVSMEQNKSESLQKVWEDLERSKEFFRIVFSILAIVVFGLRLIFILIPIYFFTRPKVKEQFR